MGLLKPQPITDQIPPSKGTTLFNMLHPKAVTPRAEHSAGWAKTLPQRPIRKKQKERRGHQKPPLQTGEEVG